MSKLYVNKTFLNNNEHSSPSHIVSSVDNDGDYKIRIADCEKSIILHGSLFSENDNNKIQLLIDSLIELQNHIKPLKELVKRFYDEKTSTYIHFKTKKLADDFLVELKKDPRYKQYNLHTLRPQKYGSKGGWVFSRF